MTKRYIKKKNNPKAIIKFRGPKGFRGKVFGGKKNFKVQHKG